MDSLTLLINFPKFVHRGSLVLGILHHKVVDTRQRIDLWQKWLQSKLKDEPLEWIFSMLRQPVWTLQILSKVSVFYTLQSSGREWWYLEWHLGWDFARFLLRQSMWSSRYYIHWKATSRQWPGSRWWWQSIWMGICQYF